METRSGRTNYKPAGGSCTRDNIISRQSSKCLVLLDDRLDDHVTRDGNVLLQQHELVMNELITEQGHKSPFQLLHWPAVNKQIVMESASIYEWEKARDKQRGRDCFHFGKLKQEFRGNHFLTLCKWHQRFCVQQNTITVVIIAVIKLYFEQVLLPFSGWTLDCRTYNM